MIAEPSPEAGPHGHARRRIQVAVSIEVKPASSIAILTIISAHAADDARSSALGTQVMAVAARLAVLLALIAISARSSE